MPRNILALDIATKTGWAMLYKGLIYNDTQDFSLRRGDSEGMRQLRFGRWLHLVIEGNNVDLIVFEQPHQRGGSASEVCMSLVGEMKRICAQCGVDHTGCHSLTLKKWATGTGKASKELMMTEAKTMWPELTIRNDNEADALWLLNWAIATFGGNDET